MPSRHRSRECALQMIYQWDFTQNSTQEVAKRYPKTLSAERQVADQLSSPEDDPFANELFGIVTDHIERIDGLIDNHATHWRIDRMSAVDRNILRLAVAELINRPAVPAVIIDEAIQVSRRFSSQESGPFLNGVLDAIRKHLEKEEPSTE